MNQADALPSGNVAFLFTDIEGSTLRWDLDRAAMQEALRRHDAIVRAAIESHGGTVFKTIGDAFCAAFPAVERAVAAATAAQRELGSQNWDAVDGLRVRMAIHIGDADERDGDYFGPAVNRVARLLSAGHGGQVLLSGIAADDAAAHLPADAGLRSLGTLPLRDLRQPERVFQLLAPGLRSAFKPLRALETPPNNLPRQTTSFVGRRGDVARVEAMLRAGQLVTIAGTGGVGKTRLALEAAFDALNDSRDGVWFVDLASLSDPALVASAVLSALGADQASDSPALDVLAACLRARELLLVLDNCEHLVAEVARVVTLILAEAPQVAILATSREALNVAGEQVYRLSSLDAPAALELFEERARAFDPAFRIDAGNRAIAEDLCRRLDGIALAIELAAARVRSVSLEELSRRLRLRMLAGGPRDRQARQQTMRALVDWSYDLLVPEERQLFRDVSVFAGGFTLESAAAVHAGDADSDDVLDRLTSLVDKSLVVVEARERSTRYRFLEPIREYARDRLDGAGDAPNVLQRHARTFAEIADRAYAEWDTAPAPDWLVRLAGDLDNVRAALEWALGAERDIVAGAGIAGGAAPMFLRLSLLREGIGWSERALEFDASLQSGARARLHYTLSMLYHNQGANAFALAAARRAAELYGEAGDDRGLTRALSQVAHHLGDAAEEAHTVAADALRRARELNDPRLLAATLQRCAFVYAPPDIEQARACFEEATSLFRSLGREDETARALGAWADAESTAGNYAKAVEIARQGLEIATDDLKLYITNLLASCYVAMDDAENGLPAAREALATAERGAHPIAVPTAMLYLAALASPADARSAARLAGYARARLKRLDWALVGPDMMLDARLTARLEGALSTDELGRLLDEGAAWTDALALAAATRVG